MQLTQSGSSEVQHRSPVAAGVQDVILKLKYWAAACRRPADPVIFLFCVRSEGIGWGVDALRGQRVQLRRCRSSIRIQTEGFHLLFLLLGLQMAIIKLLRVRAGLLVFLWDAPLSRDWPEQRFLQVALIWTLKTEGKSSSSPMQQRQRPTPRRLTRTASQLQPSPTPLECCRRSRQHRQNSSSSTTPQLIPASQHEHITGTQGYNDTSTKNSPL